MNAEEFKSAREICELIPQVSTCMSLQELSPYSHNKSIVLSESKGDGNIEKIADFVQWSFTALPAALDEIERLQALLQAPCHTATSNSNNEILELFKKLKEDDQEGHIFVMPARQVGRSAAINAMLNLKIMELTEQKDELQKENEKRDAALNKIIKVVSNDDGIFNRRKSTIIKDICDKAGDVAEK